MPMKQALGILRVLSTNLWPDFNKISIDYTASMSAQQLYIITTFVKTYIFLQF